MKYKQRFNEDFDFYYTHRKLFTFCGENVKTPEYSPKGVDAKKWFFIMDSQGKSLPCRHPRLAMSILRCKKGVNWQIKRWIEGYDDALMGVDEYLECFEFYPEWVNKAIRKPLGLWDFWCKYKRPTG